VDCVGTDGIASIRVVRDAKGQISLSIAENPCSGEIMRQAKLLVSQTSLFLAENLCSSGIMRQTKLIVRQTKLIVSYASLLGEKERFTGRIVRPASKTMRFSTLRSTRFVA